MSTVPSAPGRPTRRVASSRPISSKPSTSTLSSRTTTSTNDDSDDLANDMSALKISSTASTSKLPASTTARKPLTASRSKLNAPASTSTSSTTTRRVPVTSTKQQEKRPVREEVVEEEEEDSRSPIERSKEAKKTINLSLQTLSSLVKTAKLRAGGTVVLTSVEKDKAERATKDASKALDCVRKLVREREVGGGLVDLEKAGSGMVGSLVELGLYALAIPQLITIRSNLIALWSSSPDPPPIPPTPYQSLLIPLPPPSYFVSTLEAALSPTYAPLQTIAPLVLGVMQFLLGCLLRKGDGDMGKLWEALKEADGGPLDWRRLVRESGKGVDEPTVKRVDAMMVSMFGTLTNACVGVDDAHPPSTLLTLRILALKFLSTTPLPPEPTSTKLSNFFDHFRKVLLLYGRSAEKKGASTEEIAKVLVESFDDLLSNSGLEESDRKGAKWGELCEVVCYVARRGNDLKAVERIAGLIETPSSNIVDHLAGLSLEDTTAKITSISAKLAVVEGAFEKAITDKIYDQAPTKNFLDLSQQAFDSISILSKLRGDGTNKVDKIVRTFAAVLVKFVKRKGLRLDQLVLVNTPAEGMEKEALRLLGGVISHYEGLVKSGPLPDLMLSGAVNAVLLQVSRSFQVDLPSTYSTSFELLERSLKLLGSTSTLIPFTLITYNSVLSIVSSFMNLGAALYNHGKSDGSAVRFFRKAKEIGALVLRGKGEDEDLKVVEARELLAKGQSRRCENLGAALQSMGSKSDAYEAYVEAIVSQPSEVFLHLASSSPSSTTEKDDSPFFKLVQRTTRLATFDLLKPASVISLQPALSDRPAEQVAAVLEMQIRMLADVLEKKQAFEAFGALVEGLLEIYTREKFPLSRARTLLRRMQILSSFQNLGLDQAIHDAAREIEDLCALDTPVGHDSTYKPFAQQYFAFSHLWLAFHSHQSQRPLASDTTFAEAKSALTILRKAFDGDIQPSPSAPKRSPPRKVEMARPKVAIKEKEPVVGTSKRRVPTTTVPKTPHVGRTLPARSRTVAPPPVGAATSGDPVTPPTRTRLEHGDGHALAASRGKGTDSELLFDDMEKCFFELETMAHLLGALGFALLRTSYLQFLRRLTSRIGPKSNSTFVILSSMLGEEYVRLGRTSRGGSVFGQADLRIQHCIKIGQPVSPSAHITYYLLYAFYLATIGNHERSSQAYVNALELADFCVQDESGMATWERIMERSRLLQRVATAATTCSLMIQRRGDLSRSIPPALQSMRLWSRALKNLARLSPTSESKSSSSIESKSSSSDDVFTANSTDPKAPKSDYPPPSSPGKRQNATDFHDHHAGLVWQVSERLFTSVIRVSILYMLQGTPKSADHYAAAALELATELGSPRLSARALAVLVDVRLRAGRLDEAEEDLNEIDALLGKSVCPEAVEAQRLRADHQMRRQQALEAHQSYTDAQLALATFVNTASEGESHQSTPKHPSPARAVPKVTSPMLTSPGEKSVTLARDAILPALHAYLLRVQVTLLRMQNKHSEGGTLLQQLSRYGFTEEDRAEEMKLLASIRLQDLFARFASDPILGMLPESVLSIPALSAPIAKPDSPRVRGSALLHSLLEVEKLLSRAVTLSVSRSEPAKLRELSLLAVNTRAFQSTAGKATKRAAAGVSTLLDLGLAVTLRREMVEAIDFKLDDRISHDDLVWPASTSTSNAHSLPPESLELKFWSSIRDRYRLESPETTLLDPSFSSLLPSHWTIVSLHLTPEKDAILLSRHRRDSEPVIFKLPLDRVARREGEDESFTYDLAIEELREVVRLSDEAIASAKHLKTAEDKATWWKDRRELDARLQALTESIEVNWLGAFKTIFLDSRQFPPEAMATFKAKVEAILKTGIVRAQEKKNVRFKLDDDILGCLAALSPKVTDDDLEDLFYFILESFQFSGVPLSYDEQDVDQIICDLRDVLEELHAAESTNPNVSAPQPTPEEQHIFLLLDKSLQSFPWESFPTLRGRSVSRLPALAFLRDRLDLAQLRSSSSEPTYEIVVNANRTSVVLNPAGDLLDSQNRLEPWIDRMKKDAGWSAIVGRKPSQEELRASLREKDLFLYFGHGGAEQFISSTTIRHLPRCATTMLWGCSSGLLKDQGDFDPVGTPNHYMIAGCPALVANLWDVTDVDIDKFSQSTLTKLGLVDQSTTSIGTETLAGAVAKSRDVCKLRFLNGAAPVLYGVPVKFTLGKE